MTGDNQQPPSWFDFLTRGLVPIILGGIALFQALRIEDMRREASVQLERLQADSAREVEKLRASSALGIEDLKAELERSRLELSSTIEQGQLQLSQSQFASEEKARRDAFMQTDIPLLLSNDARERQRAVAVLLVAYPEDAKSVLETVASASSEQYQAILQPQIELASQVQATQGPWIVVVSNVNAYKDALALPNRLTGLGYSSAIYVIERYFVTAVGPYPSKFDAETAQIAIRADVSRGAYLLNLSEACPYRRKVEAGDGPGYFTCSGTGPLGN